MEPPGTWTDLLADFQRYQVDRGADDPVAAAVAFVKERGHQLGEIEILVALDQRTGATVLVGTTNQRNEVNLPSDRMPQAYVDWVDKVMAWRQTVPEHLQFWDLD